MSREARLKRIREEISRSVLNANLNRLSKIDSARPACRLVVFWLRGSVDARVLPLLLKRWRAPRGAAG